MKRPICIAAALVQLSFSASAWIADNGNGTYSNPLFYEEFSDPDMIRVGEDYYFRVTLTFSSKNFLNGCAGNEGTVQVCRLLVRQILKTVPRSRTAF